LLDAIWCGAPDRKSAVAVVIRQHHQKRTLPPDEEGRRAVAEPLVRLRQRQADRTDSLENLVVYHGKPPCAANQNALLVDGILSQWHRLTKE
jgi:hypothetical protein